MTNELEIEMQNSECNCSACRQLRICARLGMAPTVTEFPDDHRVLLDPANPSCSKCGSTDVRLWADLLLHRVVWTHCGNCKDAFSQRVSQEVFSPIWHATVQL